jgi:2,3-dihydroxybenzoate decarboxylase
MKAKFPVRYYFSQNIWITTSGHYSTANLQNAINEIGADRIIFSIDHPYEDIEEGSEWWDGVPLNPNDKVNIVCLFLCYFNGRDETMPSDYSNWIFL